MTDVRPPHRQVRADFDDEAITVYQAYPRGIADAALAAGTFVEPFSLRRMTWIKPSFLWMMYRAGWGTKVGQERVLAVRMSRAGFESALSEAALSHFDPSIHASETQWRHQLKASPVRVQWDPERDPRGQPLPQRSLQIGLGPDVVAAYVGEWILGIRDLTDDLDALRAGRLGLPVETLYVLPEDIARRIGVTP